MPEGDAELFCTELLRDRLGAEQDGSQGPQLEVRDQTYDYEANFKKMKKALSESVANHFPNCKLSFWK